MHPIDRRGFLSTTLAGAALSIATSAAAKADETDPAGDAQAADGPTIAKTDEGAPTIVDTNVHLFDWPFRRLKYAGADALVAKLRRHRVSQAWAGSFEACLHKRLDAVNARLAEECRTRGQGMFVPMGSVNPAWPDWEEDVRRCQEQHGMPGIRLYPSYHGYTFDHPEFGRLLEVAARRGLLVQIALEMEDERVVHPAVIAPEPDAAALVDRVRALPSARIELLNARSALLSKHLPALVALPNITFDISNIDGDGGVGRLIDGTHWNIRHGVPVERLLFGSQAPYFPCETAVLKLFESPLPFDSLVAIVQGNARRLLDGATAAARS